MSLELEAQGTAGFEYDNRPVDDILQESDMTADAEEEEEEGGGGWLSGIGADFRNIANTLKEAGGAIGDLANFVQRSALSVAAEIAQLEGDLSDDEALDMEQVLNLPWEILTDTDPGQYQEDEELKASIMALSSNRETFLKPFSVHGNNLNSPACEDYNLMVLDEPRIHQIRRLLVIDENLAVTHSILSGRSDVKETIFWTNYFYNCEMVRREHLEKLQSSSLISNLSCPEEELTSDAVPTVEEDARPASKPDGLKKEELSREEDDQSRSSSQNSLVPADDCSLHGSEAAQDDFVQVTDRSGIASPPCSLLSVEDLIVVSKHISADN